MSKPTKPINPESINESFLYRFHSRYTKSTPTECWKWLSTTNVYGVISYSIPIKGLYYAHRIMWYLTHNNIDPAPLQVLHTCDNPICVNPDHLFLGTILDNNQDKTIKGRARNGSTILTQEQVDQLLVDLTSEDNLTQQTLADKYGVSRPAISHIVAKARLDGISLPNWGVRLNETMANEIKAKRAAGERVIDLATEYNVTRHTITNILHNRTWK